MRGKIFVISALVVTLALFAGNASADTLNFNLAFGNGSASYAGGTAPLLVSGVSAASVTDLTTSAPKSLTGSCGGYACLDLTSGDLSGSSSSAWTFAGNSTPGAVSILGSFDGNPSTDLLTGTVSSAQVVNGGNGADVSIAVILNSIDPGLLTAFGIPTSPNSWNGTLSLSFTLPSSVAPPSGFTSTTIVGGNLLDVDPPAVPEPSTFSLLAVGLSALALLGFWDRSSVFSGRRTVLREAQS